MEKNNVNMPKKNNVPRNTVYYILGLIETLLTFRLVFKLLGANPWSAFASLIYTISGIFMAPFSGIFRAAINNGIETTSVLEPTTIIAMVVYALVAYGVVKLIEIKKTPKDEGVQ